MFNFFKKRKKVVVSSKKVFGACFVLVLLCGTFATMLLPNVAFAGLSDYISGTELARDFFAVFFSYISEALLRITSLVLYVSGIILKHVIEISIVEMGKIIDSGGVRSAWSTFRDIANMSFIFIILYIAISTILGTGVNMRKTLVRVVIVALLLNFSFFFTKIVVDASNILTVGFYNQIINTPCTPDGGQPAGDLGSAFMCQMGLATVWNADIINDVVGNAVGLEIGTILVRGVMGSLFFLIAAFVFLAASLMFLARLVTFIFLFTLSPLAFGAMALPNDEYSNKWKEPLIKNSIFAPAFMLAIWAALKVLGGINQILFPNGRNLNLTEALIGRVGGVSQNAGQVFMNYAIVIAMIIGALIVAEKFGAYGAGAAIKILDKSRKDVQGYVNKSRKNAQGYVARNTIGRYASKTDKYLENKGYDGRGSRFVRGLTTGALAEAKFGGEKSFKEQDKKLKELRTDIANKAEERSDKSKLKAATLATATPAQIDDAQRIFNRMTPKEIDNLGYKGIAPHIEKLNPNQLEHILEKSEKFNEQERSKVREERFKKVKTLITNNDPTARQAVRALSDKEMELIDSTMLSNTTPDGQRFIGHMSDSQVENFLKSARITAAQKKMVRDERSRSLKDAVDRSNALSANATPAQIAAARQDIAVELKRMKPQNVAKLDSAILTNIHVISQLTPAMLSKMPDEQDTTTLQTIGAEIRRTSPNGGPLWDYITNGMGKGLF